MPELKMSLHVSGIRRLAWTKEYAVRHLQPNVDRVVARWDPVQAGPGWMHELDIWVAEEDVDTMVPVEGRHRSLQEITWIEKPAKGMGVVFRIFTTQLGARPASVDTDEAIWLMGLPLIGHRGGPEACLILASAISLTEEHLRLIADARLSAKRGAPRNMSFDTPGARVISVGLSSTAPMSPILFDLGGLNVASSGTI